MESEDSKQRISNIFWAGGTTCRCPLKPRPRVIYAGMKIRKMFQCDARHFNQLAKNDVILLVIQRNSLVKCPLLSEKQ